MTKTKLVRGEVQVKKWVEFGDKIIHQDFSVEVNPTVDPDVNWEVNKAWGILKEYYGYNK